MMKKRFALLIGNGTYPDHPLDNPVADARLLAAILEQCGFDTDVGLDLDGQQMQSHLDAFRMRLEAGGTLGLLFFAGHGCELGNDKFLLPIDCPVSLSVNAIVNFAVSITQLEKIFAKAATPLVILMDACRDQLDTDNFLLPDQYKQAHQHRPSADSLYVFSTASGQSSSDGKPGGRSPFVAALASAFADHHLDIEQLIKRAIDGTSRSTGDGQRARTEGALRHAVPLSATSRLKRGQMLSARAIKGIYGLSAHPENKGVLAWSGQGGTIFEVSARGAVPWVVIKSGDLRCTTTSGSTLWFSVKHDGKVLLGWVEEAPGQRNIRSFEIALSEAHTISVDTTSARVYVAGKFDGAGRCAVYFPKESRVSYIDPPKCRELYAAKEIFGERVVLVGPGEYASMFSWSDRQMSEFVTDYDRRGRKQVCFYSIQDVEAEACVLLGSSNGQIHTIDINTLVIHPPLTLPVQWSLSEHFAALGDSADPASIEKLFSAPSEMEEEGREWLREKLDGHNVLFLHRTADANLLLACTDAGRVYTLTLPELKIIDVETSPSCVCSGQTVVNQNGDIYTISGENEIQGYSLAKVQ